MRVFAYRVASALAAAGLLAQEQKPPAPPEYFDEPKFIVADVTDPSQRGGHGSDPVLRSAESLAKETAALRTIAPGATSAADAAEKQGNALEAVREYQSVAALAPREAHLLD